MDIAGFYGSLRIYFSADLATGTTGGVSTRVLVPGRVIWICAKLRGISLIISPLVYLMPSG